MSEEVVKYDSHRFDDVFYAYTELFMKRSFTEVSWSNNYDETNYHRLKAFPIDVVRPYVERLLQAHGTGPLLHTIIAANFECEPTPTNGGQFSFVVNNPRDTYRMTNDLMGLVAAFGLDVVKAPVSVYDCLRCKSSIQRAEMSTMSVYELLRLHVAECEMSMDERYLKPLTEFARECDRDEYVNFLHKSVVETVLTKLGLLIVRQKRFEELPFSAFARNRRMSLYVLLRSRKRPHFDDDALNRMVYAGYHTFPTPKLITNWGELKKALAEFSRRPISDYKIMCFSCDHTVTLSAEVVSDPWRYHAKKSPSCRFLLMKKGMNYVKRVQESMYNFRPRNNDERTAAAAINPELDLQPPTTPVGEFFDMCKDMTSEKKTKSQVTLSATTINCCIVCSIERSTVALMSCSHIVTCVDCSFAIRDCPLCRTSITGFMMPKFQPDGAFWKQLECVGGNYFINLPCRHLIETCVPDNVSRCPKADAVEEDNTYCIVCDKMNLGKIRVYL